jgi:hypothetical protein
MCLFYSSIAAIKSGIARILYTGTRCKCKMQWWLYLSA